ncbi:MAG: hypothetical protein AM326_05455 [Candidatus Thorarchaeota archaeon SMTZ-45]|nr:MAG: hypothetical protein AM326_05455 [Candidatus Thorarchaeota archaeon SMTZ-45]
MSVLKKYRDAGEEERDSAKLAAEPRTGVVVEKPKAMVAIPNKERRSPIVSFSFTTELRSCLQDVRNEKAINLSMWVERKLRKALTDEFPDIADKHLEV